MLPEIPGPSVNIVQGTELHISPQLSSSCGGFHQRSTGNCFLQHQKNARIAAGALVYMKYLLIYSDGHDNPVC